AVRDVRATGFEQGHLVAAGRAGVDAGNHALHGALVVFVRAVHVEELEARPLRRGFLAFGDRARDTPVEQVLAPAVQVQRTQPGQGFRRAVVVVTLLAGAIGRRRGRV